GLAATVGAERAVADCETSSRSSCFDQLGTPGPGTRLQPMERLDDEVGAIASGQPRGVEHQVIQLRVGRILVKVILDEAGALGVRLLHPARRILLRNA